MEGKEALIHLSKNCKELELEYGNFKINKKDNEALQTLKEIVQKHDKYKKVFEIFKRLDGPGRALLIAAIFDIATDEEYELLEELIKSEN